MPEQHAGHLRHREFSEHVEVAEKGEQVGALTDDKLGFHDVASSVYKDRSRRVLFGYARHDLLVYMVFETKHVSAISKTTDVHVPAPKKSL